MMADENNNETPAAETPAVEPTLAGETQSQGSGDGVEQRGPREARGGRGGRGGGGGGGRDNRGGGGRGRADRNRGRGRDDEGGD